MPTVRSVGDSNFREVVPALRIHVAFVGLNFIALGVCHRISYEIVKSLQALLAVTGRRNFEPVASGIDPVKSRSSPQLLEGHGVSDAFACTTDPAAPT